MGIDKTNKKHLHDIINAVSCNEGSAFFYTPAIYKNSKSYLFHKPVEVVETNNPGEFQNCLFRIDSLINKGLYGCGYITYEAGYLPEKSLNHLYPGNGILLRFRFFRKKDLEIIKSDQIIIEKWDEQKNNISGITLNTDRETYINNINRIKSCIAEGDTYQVNYTVKSRFNFSGSYPDLFSSLIFNQSSRYSAFINDGENIIISLSPELFFRTDKRKIITTPMKGTSPRGFNNSNDNNIRNSLRASTKNRAENLMIVDLLRNDLGRICKYGSVKVSSLFRIEKYESLYQKVSEVKGKLKNTSGFPEIVSNMFPCGSITGAPKIKTMEIIRTLEGENRGVYTGCIGMVNRKSSVFNVAIRSITLTRKSGKGEMGVGGGIVWDSNPGKEYDEAVLKSDFLLKQMPYFELFETMLVKNGEIFLKNEHLNRLCKSAGYFLFGFNINSVETLLSSTLRKLDVNRMYRMRLSLTKSGEVICSVSEYIPSTCSAAVKISSERISSEDKFRYFKTTNRHLYNKEYTGANNNGLFDVLFLNERGEVCEGAISNIFIRKGSKWLTPPVNCGLLPGVYRNYHIKTLEKVYEKPIFPNDLYTADEIILTNSLRGIIKVEKVL